jgi:alkylation response protein AidB-like acyl-CoA dehydrogenase
VLLSLSSDQEFFRDTTARFLTEHAPPTEIRRLRDDPAGFGDRYWRLGADLGWTSLLVDEGHGGGSISGDGVMDLTLVAHEFGRHAAPGPLVPTNLVARAVSDLAADRHADLLSGLLDGTSIASWCHLEPRPNDGLDDIALEVRVDGSDVLLNGVKRPVEAAEHASHLLVTGRTGAGLTQILVPADTPGISIRPMHTVDLTRRFYEVAFEDVRLEAHTAVGEIGEAAGQVDHQLQLAMVMANSESVGAMQFALDMTVEWAFDRYSFGRPLASYQELKHRFADMKTWLEAAHAISDTAAEAVSSRSPEAGELVSAAKAFIGAYGSELVQDCVQIHGGIGLTFEHDIHFFLRRVTVNRALYGTPSQHRQRIASMMENVRGAA